MRVLALSRLDGRAPAAARSARSAAKSSASPIPAAASCSPRPRCGSRSGHTTMFVADENGTAAYVLRARAAVSGVGELTQPGTSPVMAGGLLYVYDPSAAGSTSTARARPGRSPSCRAPGPLEQPDRRRRTRGRARGQRQRPHAQRHARDLLGRLERRTSSEQSSQPQLAAGGKARERHARGARVGPRRLPRSWRRAATRPPRRP